AARLGVAREERGARGTADGRVDTVRRPGTRVREAVRVDDREADAGPRDLLVEAGVVRALREPRPRGPAPDDALEAGHAEDELRADALARREHAGQVAVGGRAREKL